MKKQVLLSAGILVTGLLGAQVTKKVSKVPANLKNVSATKYPKSMEMQPAAFYGTKTPSKSDKSVKRTSAFTMGVIGTTYYDLQSNSSVGDRIVVNADGSIAAVWTMEATNVGDPYPNRGTGYAYFDGTTWSAPPTTRVEATRVGWGNIVNTRSGKELILSHDGNLLNLASRAAKGTGTWANSTTAVPSATTGGNLWPRMVSAGDTVYAISVTQQTTTAGAALYQGLNGAVCFSRSKDAGATWDITNVIPTGLTSANFLGFGGDSYAIAAKGSTVAIVAGDSGKDLVLTKSTDGGVTWTATTVLKFPLVKWDPSTTITDANSDGVADTLDTNDGTLAVGLDHNNMAYVFYGNARILQTAPQTNGSYSYFPYTDGLNMWKEGMPANLGGDLIAAIEDLGQQGTIYFPTPGSGNLAFGRWSNSLTSFPSVAFDANTIYLTYSSIVDSLISIVNADKLVRHQYVIKSTDGGVTWTDPCDIVGSPDGDTYEGVLGSIAKRVDGNVHIIYQRDFGPGNSIPGTGAANPDQGDNTSVNDIVYFKFPTAEIGACSIDVGVKEQSSVVSGMKFYPNPASTNGTLEISLNDNSKMDISILNAVGQVVYSTSINGNAGNNKVDLNLSNLSNGIYFYQVKTANSKSITNKFVIAK